MSSGANYDKPKKFSKFLESIGKFQWEHGYANFDLLLDAINEYATTLDPATTEYQALNGEFKDMVVRLKNEYVENQGVFTTVTTAADEYTLTTYAAVKQYSSVFAFIDFWLA